MSGTPVKEGTPVRLADISKFFGYGKLTEFSKD